MNAGQVQSGITFNAPAQETHSVRGVLWIRDSSRTGAHVAEVTWVSLDGGFSGARYDQQLDFDSASVVSSVKYFRFENVLPGRYTAYISVLGRGWYTKKEEVNVTSHMKFVVLDLYNPK